MKEFYHVLRDIKEEKQVVTLTGISGAYYGYKGIFCQGRPVYQSDETKNLSAWLCQADCRNMRAGIFSAKGGELYIEPVSKEKELLICGGGHVANAVIRLADFLGFFVTVIEDRREFAEKSQQSGASRVILSPFLEGLQTIQFHENLYVLIMTRDHAYDRQCLKYLLGRSAGYLGMLGSRRRAAALRKELAEEGIPKEWIDKLHSPAGLDIHAQTPEEIAVSILGELIALKNHPGNGVTCNGAVEAYLFQEAWKQDAVLITIIGKCGSAPRDVGTKMIVTRDGSLFGTIGGGCLEAEAVKMAGEVLLIYRQEKKQIYTSSYSSMKEGMHCGGEVKLLFEVL